MIDYPDAIRDYLVSQSALTALTSTRIWAEMNVPPPGYVPAQGAAITFATRGGAPLYAPVLNPRVQFRCFGATPYAANTLNRTLYDVLHEASSATMKRALCDQLGQPLQEEDTGWYFVLSFYLMWF